MLTGLFSEDYSSEVRSSGSLVAGVWLGDVDGLVSLEDILVRIPMDYETPQVCLIATTRDGLYYSEGALSSDINPSGFFEVENLNKSSYRDELSQYMYTDLAIRVSPGQNCASANESKFFPPSLGTLPPTSATVLLNARGGDIQDLQAKIEGESRLADCKKNTRTRSFGYNTICVLDIKGTSLDSTLHIEVHWLPASGPARLDDIYLEY